MDPGTIIMGLAALASLVGGGASAASKAKSQREQEKAAEEEKEKQERLALRQAMARSLGTEGEPYVNPNVKQPTAPNTAWSDILQGVGQVGMQGAAQYEADRMYPTTQTGGGTTTSRIPRRTQQGYIT